VSRSIPVQRNCNLTSCKTRRFETKYLQEKCVDISLAVEMLYMSAIPDAFDIAVIVTGDKDFIPALEKTRMRAKKVAICSVRSSCNKDLIKPESRVRDFDVIWLDDYVDDLLIPRRDNSRLGEWYPVLLSVFFSVRPYLHVPFNYLLPHVLL
jgi:hypothetical protein